MFLRDIRYLNSGHGYFSKFIGRVYKSTVVKVNLIVEHSGGIYILFLKNLQLEQDNNWHIH
jgi:hypothetical protein